MLQVINATGPFSDSIRHMSDPDATSMIMASAGVHVTLPDYYSPEHLGMIVPKTKDGRVVFMLPWLDATIAGTTGDPIALLSSQLIAVPIPKKSIIGPTVMRYTLACLSSLLLRCRVDLTCASLSSSASFAAYDLNINRLSCLHERNPRLSLLLCRQQHRNYSPAAAHRAGDTVHPGRHC